MELGGQEDACPLSLAWSWVGRRMRGAQQEEEEVRVSKKNKASGVGRISMRGRPNAWVCQDVRALL
jgi:hypothetical protein